MMFFLTSTSAYELAVYLKRNPRKTYWRFSRHKAGSLSYQEVLTWKKETLKFIGSTKNCKCIEWNKQFSDLPKQINKVKNNYTVSLSNSSYPIHVKRIVHNSCRSRKGAQGLQNPLPLSAPKTTLCFLIITLSYTCVVSCLCYNWAIFLKFVQVTHQWCHSLEWCILSKEKP